MIIGRVTFLIGKAIIISLDGSSRDLRLGDRVDSTETIKVSAGGEVVITDNNGVPVSINGNESWVAETGQFNSLPQIDPPSIDPTSIEAIQAALLAGIDPTTIGEATAAGNQSNDQQPDSEGSSFVRVDRGNTASIDSGLDFYTIAQSANTQENSVFDVLLRAESSEPTGPFTGLSRTPPLTGFNAFDDVDSNGLSGSREVISNNSFTNDSTPIYSGSSTPGSIIRIYDNNILITTTTVDADGNWEIQSPDLEDTAHSITVTAQQDGSTESAPNGPLNFTVDTSIPAQTAVITNVYDDVNEVGDIANSGITDDTAPQLQGTLSAVLAGDEVLNVLRDNVVVGQATVDATDPANVTWIFDDVGLAQGVEYEYQVQVVDAANNTGDLSNIYSINIIDTDASAPSQTAVITNVYDDVNDVGDVASGDSTDDTTPQLQGSLSSVLAGDEVLNVLRDNVVIGQATIDATDPANVTWIFDDSGLVDGVGYEYQVQVVDASNNGGDLSNSYSISINSSAPAQNISIDFITDDVDPQVGDFDSGSSTNDVTPLINGGVDQALAVDEYIIVYRDGVEIGQAMVDSSDPDNITWSFLDDIAGNILENGESYQYTARIFDGPGNGGTLSDVFNLTIDTALPDAIAVNLSDNSDTYLELFNTQIGSKFDNKTLDKQLEFNGEVSADEAGSVIVFYAYATQASIAVGDIADTGVSRLLLDGQDSSVIYDTNNRFMLGTAIVGTDGKYVMRMEDTDGEPLLSSQNAIYNNAEVDQYYLHVNAVITDLAGNESEVSDDLDIIIDTRSVNENTRDPLILDLNNDGTYTSSINAGIKFDHNGDGEKEHSGWVSANDGFLALDLNNDGLINNGSELFGNDTMLGKSSGLAGDGFEALSQYDSDNNLIINENDDIYDDLRVWVDQNQNGITDEGELKTLLDLNIDSISLKAEESNDVDHGNSIIKVGYFVQNGDVKDIVDADLALGPSGDTAYLIELLPLSDSYCLEDADNEKTNTSVLMVKVTLPQSIINGDYLVVAVNGPTGVHSFTHQIATVDNEQGFIVLPIPNEVIELEGNVVSGEYGLSLIASNNTGATVVLSENIVYQLDYDNAEITTVLMNSDNDHSVNNDLDVVVPKNVGSENGLEKAAIMGNNETPVNALSTMLDDDLTIDLIDLDKNQQFSMQGDIAQTSDLPSSLDLFDNVNENDSLEQYFQFQQDGADLKVFVNEGGGFNGHDNVYDTATDIFIVQNFNVGDSVYEDVISKIMENKVEIDG
jgi:hypothetical protein